MSQLQNWTNVAFEYTYIKEESALIHHCSKFIPHSSFSYCVKLRSYILYKQIDFRGLLASCSGYFKYSYRDNIIALLFFVSCMRTNTRNSKSFRHY